MLDGVNVQRIPFHQSFERAALRAGLRRKEGLFSLLTRLFATLSLGLKPRPTHPAARRTRKRDRAISSRPAKAGLEHRGWSLSISQLENREFVLDP
jgi:hypothetical protein